jgi:hypothetical protein
MPTPVALAVAHAERYGRPMGRTDEHLPGPEPSPRRRLRSRLRWAVPLTLLLVGGAAASAGSVRAALRIVETPDRITVMVVATAAAILGCLGSWRIALRWEHLAVDEGMVAGYRARTGARAVVAFLIVFFLSGVGPGTSAIAGSFLAGVLASTALVVVVWTVDRTPSGSAPPERLSGREV